MVPLTVKPDVLRIRGILYFFTRHTGEHTGQLIAYARFNGIVLPWSDER